MYNRISSHRDARHARTHTEKKIVIPSPPHSQVLMGLRRGKNAYTQYDLSFFFSFLFRQFHFCLFFNFLGFFSIFFVTKLRSFHTYAQAQCNGRV